MATPAFTSGDRFVLAGLLGLLPRGKLRHLALLVRPETILRWHRDLLRRRDARVPQLIRDPGHVRVRNRRSVACDFVETAEGP
ncbi:hypothetical protein ACIBF7_44370, partial [Nonomuraea sp. NPDC050478]|uniref:hypothetical protein n=1 Tax=Nonomuraea sp. NPDC050478 TaxID=3364365 RepID=UPI0037A25D6A